jgi:single-strand DNA-binding protein
MSNSFHTVGNLTRDPELRYTSGGRGVASFGIADNRRYQKDGEWVEEVSFFNVTAWGTLGENVAQCLSKGSRIIVTGRLQQRSWEDTNGEKRSVVEVVADEIGPSLRWATVEVHRTEREKAPRENEAPPPRAPAYGDEEPFS